MYSTTLVQRTAPVGIVLVAFFAVFVPSAARADDTFSCLNTYTGPTVTPSGTITTNTTSDSGYRYSSTELQDNTRFDARSAFFRYGPSGDNIPGGSAFVLHRATTSSDSVCIAGGKYQGLFNRDISWWQSHAGNGMWSQLGGPDTTVDGVRADNIAQDMFIFGAGAQNFHVKNNWVSYVRDDCIQNDNRFSGVAEDNLFDGCYVFLSHQNESDRDGSADKVVVKNNLIRQHNMPKPFDYENYGNDPTSMGFGGLWKQAVGTNKPKVDVVGNVFWLEDNLTPRPSLRYEKFQVELSECRDIVLVWKGEGPWPDSTWQNLPQGCISKVLQGEDGEAFLQAARKNWINCHPKVSRLDGDSVSDPDSCNLNAYGGGGTADPRLSCTLVYPTASTPASGFGASWNQFTSAKELLLSATCSGSNLNVTAGNTDATTYVYKTGYRWANNAWQSYMLSGSRPNGDWFQQSATASITKLPGTTYFVGYTCQRISGAWKCGCSDSTCATSKWQLQGVE